MNLLIGSTWNGSRRRERLYAGDVFVFTPAVAAMALVNRARELLESAFAPHHPTVAQYHMSVEEYAAVLARVKPAFIHDPLCKRLIPQLVEEVGGDISQTYFDVPRMRSATAHDYLTTGIAYAFHPHRDTWYSAAQAQINWWFPIYEIEPDNGMVFYPHWFGNALENSSDTRVQPRLTSDVNLEPGMRVVPPVGGVMMFSAQHLHATVPNTTEVTRFSIDFRTVHRGDLEQGRGAPNVDSRCTGTVLRDFLSGVDLSRLPADVIAKYDDESALEYAQTLIYGADEKDTKANNIPMA